MPATFGPAANEIELAWAAGLWDGEGSIGCYVSRANIKGAVKASLAQNDPEVLHRFRSAVGMGTIYPKGADAYQWALNRYLDTVEFCRLLSPRVGTVKRRQMEAALLAYVIQRYDA